MANIFKRIKTIEPMGDAPKDIKPSAKDSQEAVRLGLTPVLKTKSGELANAADFQDPFGSDDEADLLIPEFEDETVQDPKETHVETATDETPPSKGETIEQPNVKQSEIPPETTFINTEPEAPISKIETNTESTVNPPNLNPIKPLKHKPISLSVPTTPDKKLHLHPVHNIAKLSSHHTDQTAPALATLEERTIDDEAEASDKLPRFLSSAPRRGTPDADDELPDYAAPKWPYWTLGLIGFLWLLASAAAAYGYFELGLDKLTAEPIHAFGFIGFVIVPACLLGLTAILLRYLNQLAMQSQKLAHLNRQLLTPAQHTSQSTARLVDDITQQMDRIEQRADQALSRLMTVQSVFSSQIDDMGERLKTSAQAQINLDHELRESKSAWAGTVKETDQGLTELSNHLEGLSESFHNRVETTQTKLTDLNAALGIQIKDINHQLAEQSQSAGTQLTPLLVKAEDIQDRLNQHKNNITSLEDQTRQSLSALDDLLHQQLEKLEKITSQQEAIKSSNDALSAAWDDEDNAAQDRLFRHISQIDRLNERTDVVIKKIDDAAARLSKAGHQQQNSPQNLHLRGTIQEEQLSLLPGLGAAKDMLPSLLTPEAPIADQNNDAIFSYRELENQKPNPPRETPPKLDMDIPEPLSSHRVFGGQDPVKQNWFKRFGRRATDAIIPQTPTGPVSAPPLSRNMHNEPAEASHAQFDFHIDSFSLRDKLITMQLSPDALIDIGAIHHAAHLRIKDGPFAMSRHIATHLGAAIDYLRGQLPDDTALRRQVYDMAAGFPLRERLDEQDEDSLITIFESQAGREYLLCDAALNG